MWQIDWATLINWVISGLIGLIFGVVGGWVTYRFDRKRDDIAWEREKQKMQSDWQHERELLEAQFQRRLEELELQVQREERNQVREKLLAGVDNPADTITTLQRARQIFERERELLVQAAELHVPTPQITEYLLMLQRVGMDELSVEQLTRITSEMETANLALRVLDELKAKLEQSQASQDAELGIALLEEMKARRVGDSTVQSEVSQGNKCSNCGQSYEANALFCPRCGAKTKERAG